MKKVWLLVVVFYLSIPNLSLADTADHLLISQIQITGGAGLTTNDFIEIYNPTAADVDINDWKLIKTASSGAESSLVAFAA